MKFPIIKLSMYILLILLLGCQRIQSDWIVLFDGSHVDAWRGRGMQTFPSGGWIVEKEALIVLDNEDPRKDEHGDIITREQFSDFELSLEFKLTEGANSGIKYFFKEDVGVAPEYQILDDANHPDAKQGKHGNRTVASLYDLIPAKSGKNVNPVGEWNHARILARDNHVEHWLNGEKVLEYQRGTHDWRVLVSESKYHETERFGEQEAGHILLQDHTDEVHFKNIKIRKLN